MFPLTDSHGNVSPQMKPVRHLAWVACSYIMWQNSTEDTWYKMAQIQTVKQVVCNFSLQNMLLTVNTDLVLVSTTG